MPEGLTCPICGKPVAIADQQRPKSFPFCTPRCRDRDFGRWVNGEYAVAGEPANGQAQVDADAAGDQR